MRRAHDDTPHPLTLGNCISWGRGASTLSASAQKKVVHGVQNDSRIVRPGEVFVAIVTDKDDGHRYVSAAFEKGAAAAIVDKHAVIECSLHNRKKLIKVASPLASIQRIAAYYRRELGCLIIGITGSSGKTTTRHFIATVLGAVYPIGETRSNWNNHLGVPMSLLSFAGDEWAGVIEMGANHQGEISVLSKIAAPDIAVITNIGYAHVGLFGSLGKTTAAKFEIIDGLNTKGGFLLANGDDARVVAAAKKSGATTIFFGCSRRCSIRAENIRFFAETGLEFEVDGFAFRLSVPGRHFLYSALPAIFLGRRCGIPDEIIAKALTRLKPVTMRGVITKKKKVAFILDCYNANPSSMKTAVEQLIEIAPAHRRVAVVGDMLELGRYAPRLHREVGVLLAQNKVKKIIAVGQFSTDVAKGAMKAGVDPNSIVTVETAEAAAASLRCLTVAGDTVLLKGSRGVHLEKVYETF
jgi:UDP-N-acetylmuramoyl-tripeptide--D-alanyl-D-alanine ligase